MESYRRLLGIVEQDIFLFDGTIAENIGYARRHATAAEIQQAAHLAHADEFIVTLPDGVIAFPEAIAATTSSGERW